MNGNHKMYEAAPRMLSILEWMITEYVRESNRTGRDELVLSDENMAAIYRAVKAAGGHIEGGRP